MTNATATPAYVRPDGDPYTDDQIRRIEQFLADLLSGKTHLRAANSARSVYGYLPPIGRDAWGHAVETFGRMARSSDSLAQIAVAALATIPNLYGTDADIAAGIHERISAAISAGYDDVLRRSGPEPCRHSDAHRPYGVGEVVLVAYWTAEALALISDPPAIGWCLSAIARAYGVDVTPRRHVWPMLFAAENRRLARVGS